MTVCSYYFMSSRVLSCEYCFDYQIKWRNQRRGEKDWMQCACKLLSLNFQLMLQVLQCLFPFLIHWLKPLQLWQCRRSHVLLGLIFTQTQCQHSLIAIKKNSKASNQNRPDYFTSPNYCGSSMAQFSPSLLGSLQSFIILSSLFFIG